MNFISQRHRPEVARRPAYMRLLLLAVALTPMAMALAQSSPPPEYDLKAAFLFHFGQFVEWPDKTFTGPRAPLVIGLYGSDPFHGDLERIVANQNINGHRVVVRQVVALSELKECNVVFVCASEQPHQAGILAALDGTAVLTVTEDMNDFSRSGFMIDLFVTGDKVRFAINQTAAERAGLKISPKLLNLAQPPP